MLALSAHAQQQQQQPQQAARVQIINATSVPEVSLGLDGKTVLPSFPQGHSTPVIPLSGPAFSCQVRDSRTAAEAESAPFHPGPGSFQSLVILGDFSTDTPPGQLPQPGGAPAAPAKPFPPNIVFQLVPHEDLASDGSVRLHIINGMPRRTLTIRSGADTRALAPGESLDLRGLSPESIVQASVDGEPLPITVPQRGVLRNALVVVYLKDNRPVLARCFEDTAAYRQQRGRRE